MAVWPSPAGLRRVVERVGVELTGAAFGLFGLQAAAHHGWGGQKQDQFELTGKLQTDVSLAGAHGSMQIVDDQGQVWDITLAPAARTERAGLKPGVIPMGATVTISGPIILKRNR